MSASLVGSEMCIRDSPSPPPAAPSDPPANGVNAPLHSSKLNECVSRWLHAGGLTGGMSTRPPAG
eukprot:15043049-Alexandrium_andersonii.AAC.1